METWCDPVPLLQDRSPITAFGQQIWRVWHQTPIGISKLSRLSLKGILATTFALSFAASSASAAACWVVYPDGTESYLMQNNCLFMGNDADFQNFAASVCEGKETQHMADWNDKIVAVRFDGAGQMGITLHLDVVANENNMTYMSDGPGLWQIPTDSPFYKQASVAICR